MVKNTTKIYIISSYFINSKAVIHHATPSSAVDKTEARIGFDEFAPEATNPALWNGENLLGFALMEVRDRLREISTQG